MNIWIKLLINIVVVNVIWNSSTLSFLLSENSTTQEQQVQNTSRSTASTEASRIASSSSNYKSLPAFSMQPISYDECMTLDTRHCIVTLYSSYCIKHSSKVLKVVCLTNATEPEVARSMSQIAHLNRSRPLQVLLDGSYNVTAETFTSVKDNIVWLIFSGNGGLNFHKFRQFDLPNLIDLRIDSAKRLQIFKGDLDGFPRLRLLRFSRCKFASIEEGSFEAMPVLKLLSLYYTGGVGPTKVTNQLRKLHCDCEYAWLRTIFRSRPYLLKDRAQGEIYDVEFKANSAYQQRDLFTPVDCVAGGAIGLANQTSFSINEDCCVGGNSSHAVFRASGSVCISSFIDPLSDPDVDPGLYTTAQIAAAMYVTWMVYPILLLICTLGNVLSLFVLIHERPKGSTNTYLMTVTISDLFVLWLYLPEYLNLYFQPDLANPAGNRYPIFAQAYLNYRGINSWGHYTFILLSNWTLLVFSFERIFAIINPLEVSRIVTLGRSWLICVAVLGLSSVTNLYFAISYYAYEIRHVIDAGDAPLWLLFWANIHDRAKVAIPVANFVVLLITNAVIISLLQQRRTSQMGGFVNVNSKQQFRNSNMLLMGSAALYLVTHLPISVHYLLIIGQDEGLCDYQTRTQEFIKPFAYMSFLVNYSANCYVYLLASQRFRDQLVALLPRYGGLTKAVSGLRLTVLANVSSEQLSTLTQVSSL